MITQPQQTNDQRIKYCEMKLQMGDTHKTQCLLFEEMTGEARPLRRLLNECCDTVLSYEAPCAELLELQRSKVTKDSV